MTDVPAPLRIGPHEVGPPVVLAPMAGITNAPFRRLCRGYGGGLYVSEMITTRALVERDPETMRLIEFGPDESPRIPALYRTRLAPGPAMVPELIASGVENMQVRFGRFDPALGTQYHDPAAVADWDTISSVQVTLLMRGTAVEPGYQNTTTYEIADQKLEVSDGYRRTVLSTVVQLRN